MISRFSMASVMTEFSEPSPELRSKLLAVAYRMLGSAADAEDAVQDAFVRLQEAGRRGAIANPEAWLVKVTTRLCLDRLRQARRRQEYHGPWLPEPVPNDWAGAASDRAELADSLSMAFLVLLETLSPAERATYLLREAFGYEFNEIGALLDKTPANVRQILARARKRIEQHERRFEPSPAQAEELAGRFFAACQAGEMGAIESLLAGDVTYYSDGGGKVHASPRPLVGSARVARVLAKLFHKLQASYDLSLTTVNGQPGVVFYAGDRPVVTYSASVRNGRIGEIYAVINPDKLAHWQRPEGGAGGQ